MYLMDFIVFGLTNATMQVMPGYLDVNLPVGHLDMIENGLNSLNVLSLSPTGFHTATIVVSGIFVLFAVALSTFLIFEHLSWYNNPEVSYSISLLAYNL